MDDGTLPREQRRLEWFVVVEERLRGKCIGAKFIGNCFFTFGEVVSVEGEYASSSDLVQGGGRASEAVSPWTPAIWDNKMVRTHTNNTNNSEQ